MHPVLTNLGSTRIYATGSGLNEVANILVDPKFIINPSCLALYTTHKFITVMYNCVSSLIACNLSLNTWWFASTSFFH